jgi:hypothetical protein
MVKDFLPFFQAQLQQLKAETEAYPDDASIWCTAPGISNSTGNLVVHLCGNLNHFIGHGLGNTGYVRDRTFEFSVKNLSKAVLVKMVDDTRTMMEEVLPESDGLAPYPDNLFGYECTVNQALMRLLAHFGYHLGQVNYHRRRVASNERREPGN